MQWPWQYQEASRDYILVIPMKFNAYQVDPGNIVRYVDLQDSTTTRLFSVLQVSFATAISFVLDCIVCLLEIFWFLEWILRQRYLGIDAFPIQHVPSYVEAAIGVRCSEW
jgi:hypothetical protein